MKYSPAPNNRGGGGPTNNLNINIRGVQIKGGGGGGAGLKNVLDQKGQPVITNYGCYHL